MTTDTKLADVTADLRELLDRTRSTDTGLMANAHRASARAELRSKLWDNADLLLAAAPEPVRADPAAMAAFCASDAACYKWPEDTVEHRTARAAYCEGAADAITERDQLRAELERCREALEASLWLLKRAQLYTELSCSDTIKTGLTKRARAGGAKGGPARSAALTPEQRSEIARVAAAARWKKS